MAPPIRSISIAICTFNGARFLDAQIRSVLGQAGVEEIVVVDDGSADATRAILEGHAAADPRLKIFVNETRLGVVRNFEKALRLVRCPWVALADQDDVWLPDKLARMRAAWDGAAVLLHHATHKFRGEIPVALRSPAGERRKFAGADVRRLLYRNSIVGHTTLVRAEVAKRLTPFPRDVPHDWWIGVGAAVFGPVQYVDEYLVHYRIHDTNAYHRAGSRMARLRQEHALRVNLLAELAHWSPVPEPTRRFVGEYRARLVAAEAQIFSWALWRFYWQRASLFFGRPGQRLPWFLRVRKSFAAACGAMGQGVAETREIASRAPIRRRAAYSPRQFSRVGLMALAAVMLASTGVRDATVASVGASRHTSKVSAVAERGELQPEQQGPRFWSEGKRPPFFLARHGGAFGPSESGAFRPPGPPPFGGSLRRAGTPPVWPRRGLGGGPLPDGPWSFRRERLRALVAFNGGPGGRPLLPAMLMRPPPHGGFGPPPVFHFWFRPEGMRPPREFERRPPHERPEAEGRGGFEPGAT